MLTVRFIMINEQSILLYLEELSYNHLGYIVIGLFSIMPSTKAYLIGTYNYNYKFGTYLFHVTLSHVTSRTGSGHTPSPLLLPNLPSPPLHFVTPCVILNSPHTRNISCYYLNTHDLKHMHTHAYITVNSLSNVCVQLHSELTTHLPDYPK